jgi:cytochrome c556
MAKKEELLVPLTDKTITDVLTKDDVLQTLLQHTGQLCQQFQEEIDINNLMDSKEGRKQIARNARKFASLKARINEYRIEFVRKAKEEIKAIDNAGKTVRDTLDSYRDAVRAPLTKYENAMKEAVTSMEMIEGLPVDIAPHDTEALQDGLKTVQEFSDNIPNMPEQYIDDATEIALKVSVQLDDMLNIILKAEADAKRLAKIEAEAEELRRKQSKIDAEKIKALELENEKLKSAPPPVAVPVAPVAEPVVEPVAEAPQEDLAARCESLEHLCVMLYDALPDSNDFIDGKMVELGLL